MDAEWKRLTSDAFEEIKSLSKLLYAEGSYNLVNINV